MAMIEAIDVVMTPLMWGLTTVYRILTSAGAFPIYLFMFFIGVSLRLILKPIIGEALGKNTKSRRSKSKEKPASND